MSNECQICRKDASKRCVKCLSVWYCSKECQVADWKAHKKNCKISREKKIMDDPTKLIQNLMDNHHISSRVEASTLKNKVPIYKGNEPCYSIIKIDGKGDGVVAKRDIEYGELIIQERPAMKIFSHQENEEALRILFEQLSDLDKLSVMNLHDAHAKDGAKSLLGIKQSNAYAKDAEGHLSVLCPVISKFNHSCV